MAEHIIGETKEGEGEGGIDPEKFAYQKMIEITQEIASLGEYSYGVMAWLTSALMANAAASLHREKGPADKWLADTIELLNASLAKQGIKGKAVWIAAVEGSGM